MIKPITHMVVLSPTGWSCTCGENSTLALDAANHMEDVKENA